MTTVKRSSDPEKPYFFPIENEFIDSGCFRELNKFHPSIAAVYFVLKRYRNYKTGWSCPTIERIVKNSGFSKTLVCKATRALVLVGLIEKRRAGKEFNFRMNYKIRNYDRCGFEKIAATIPTHLEQCYKKRTIPTHLEQWKIKKAANSHPLPSHKEQCHIIPTHLEHPTIPSHKEEKNLIQDEDYNKKKTSNISSNQVITQKKSQETKIKITPKKRSAEFDKTKDAGEKAFKTIIEEIQTRNKVKPANQKTIEGIKPS